MSQRTIADAIRAMDDEDLACFIICPIVSESPCEKPSEDCYECCLQWLRKPFWVLKKWKQEMREQTEVQDDSRT